MRDALRQQYIGAIVIALLAIEALRSFLAIPLMPITNWAVNAANQRRPDSVFGGFPQPDPVWQPELALLRLSEFLVYFGLASALFRWIYREHSTRPNSEVLDNPIQDPDSSE